MSLKNHYVSPGLFYIIAAVILYTAALTWYMHLRHDYFMDDAYIGFRYVDNLLSGQGLVFNPGQRVEGITNIGWALFLAPFSLLFGVKTASVILSAVFAAAAAVLSFFIAIRLTGDNSGFILALPLPLLVITQFDFIFYAQSGLETAFLAALLCFIVYLVVIDRHWLLIAALCAYAFLIHPECLLIYPLAVLLTGRVFPVQWKKLRGPSLLFVLLILAFTAVRYWYFHDLAPNTFHAKSASVLSIVRQAAKYSFALNVNIPAVFSGPWGAVLLVYGAVVSRRKYPLPAAFLTAAVLTGLLFGIYAKPDWTDTARYFAPFVPLAFVLLWTGLQGGLMKLLKAERFAGTARYITVGIAALLMLWSLVRTGSALSPASVEGNPMFIMLSESLVEPSRWMGKNLPEGSVIACQRIGAVSFYSKKNVFDFKFGLTDKTVARLVKQNGGDFDYPQHPALREVWRAEAPDYLLESYYKLEEIFEDSGGTIDSFQLHGIGYRVVKVFSIAGGREWTLCRKTEI